MKFVIGIDLSTSAVKAILVDKNGDVVAEESQSYPLIQPRSGFSEQDADEWVVQTKKAFLKLISSFKGDPSEIEGINFFGQMHGVVLYE